MVRRSTPELLEIEATYGPNGSPPPAPFQARDALGRNGRPGPLVLAVGLTEFDDAFRVPLSRTSIVSRIAGHVGRWRRAPVRLDERRSGVGLREVHHPAADQR